LWQYHVVKGVKMHVIFLSVISYCLIFSSQRSAALRQDVAMLDKCPSIDGETYQCGEMVRIVNHLRKLGKAKSLAVLREYLANGGEHDKVLMICRLLFVNPQGWKPPRLGRCVPRIDDNVAKTYPHFPLVVVNRVPFLLIRGYSIHGRGELAGNCLTVCEGFSMITEDYSLEKHEGVACDLTQMGWFRQLYDEEELPGMIEIILRQAKKQNVVGAK
jgi:hypothetical protein